MIPPTDIPPFRLVIVGHVDHGKSTLIGRLLWDTRSVPNSLVQRMLAASPDPNRPRLEYLTDNLSEERLEERTIDTTQVFLRNRDREYVIIDTPGHAEFVKNMFTGASRADAALVVIDAADGIREQTLAHLQILAFLGLKRVVPVVNKMDSVGFSEAHYLSVSESLLRKLEALGFSHNNPLPISALAGANVSQKSKELPWYHGPTLLDALDAIDVPVVTVDRLPMRFPVQGVITANGELVHLGRVEAGCIESGQQVRCLPEGCNAKVSAIRIFGGTIPSAIAGMSVGISLTPSQEQLRGSVLCATSDPPLVVGDVTVRLLWLSQQPLKQGDELTATVATRSVPVAVEAIRHAFLSNAPRDVHKQVNALRYGQIATLHLRAVSQPLICQPYDCENSLGTIVLARKGEICGAGIIPTGS